MFVLVDTALTNCIVTVIQTVTKQYTSNEYKKIEYSNESIKGAHIQDRKLQSSANILGWLLTRGIEAVTKETS
jgi:hypothetical protein